MPPEPPLARKVKAPLLGGGSCRLIEAVIAVVTTAVLAWQFSTNSLGVSDTRAFAAFQRDSEALVIGKMVSDVSGVPIPAKDQGVARANLALAWVEGAPPSYSVGIRTVLQGYDLLSLDSRLPDLKLARADYSAPSWAGGLLMSGPGIAVSNRDDGVKKYIGRVVGVDGEPRFLQSVDVRGPAALLRVSGPPITEGESTTLREVFVSGEPPSRSVIRFDPYTSQYGLQGLAFSRLRLAMGASLDSMYVTTAALLAIALSLGIIDVFGKYGIKPSDLVWKCESHVCDGDSHKSHA
jgi:hypothetical protein